MNIIETTFEKLPTKCLLIGFEGENLRATVRIDCSSVFAEYPNATPTLIVKPLFADAYPVVVDRNGTCVDWLITSEILSFSGDGEIQLIFYKDQVICKSAVSKIRVSRSLTVTGDMPDPVVQWIENANRKLAEVDAQIVELEGMVDTATDAATRAEQSASTASTKAEQAAGSAATASTKAAEAQASANTATAKASEAALSATQARNSAMSAANSESGATAKAAEAAQSAQTAAQKAEQITEAAQIATGKAEEASASARAAQTSATNAASSATAAQASQTAAKASETAAGASATQASISEQNAGTAAQTATQKAAEATQSATNAATFAGTATTKAEEAAASAQAAQDAKTAVEQTAEQLADSLEQIDQNTADIAEHEQEYNALKEATLIHNTASGSIASFVDGAEMPVDEVTVQINPVQDLHGYDHPWPAGGGKNKFNIDALVNTADITISNGNIIVKGTAKNSRKTLAEISSLTVGETYILTATSTGINNFIYLYGTNESWYFGKERTITQQDLDSTVFFYGIADASVSVTISDMMIRLASETDSAFLPYSNICPISGFEGLTVTRTGKNLINIPDSENRNTTALSILYNEIVQIKWEPLTQYVFSISTKANEQSSSAMVWYARFAYTDGTIDGYGTTIINKNNDETGGTLRRYTVVSQRGKTVSRINFNQGTGYSVDVKDVMLEKASAATDYEAPHVTSLPISWQTEAGTVYGGTLDVSTGELVVNKAYLSKRIGDMNNNDNYPGWVSSGVKNIIGAEYNNVISGAICSILGSQYIWTNTKGNNDTLFFFPLSGLGNKTQSELIAAYPDLIVDFVIPLAEPITYTLTAAQITTLLGENHLWHDANGDISVGYKANTKLYIDRKIAELVAQIVNS